MIKTKLIGIAVLALLPLSLSAKDTKDDKQLSEWKFSETVLGDIPTEENLKGKVVVIEYWGVR